MGRLKISGQDAFELEEFRLLLSKNKEHQDSLNVVKISEVHPEKLSTGFCFWLSFKDDRPYTKRTRQEREHQFGLN